MSYNEKERKEFQEACKPLLVWMRKTVTPI